MKRACLILAVSVVAIYCYGQRANTSFVASVTGVDRLSMIKNSIELPSGHEKEFWPWYEQYLGAIEKISMNTYRSREDLVQMNYLTEPEAFEKGKTFLASLHEELNVRKRYYADIGTAMNGIVALQFIQAESSMDIVESSIVYDQSRWRKFRFSSASVPEKRRTEAKYNTIASAILLDPEKAQAFYQVYASYEEESNALLGEDYDLFMLYAGEPSDYTPALAKRLGYDLLRVLEREIRLKEKYFNEINQNVGGELAARFLVWEDYHATLHKMLAMTQE